MSSYQSIVTSIGSAVDVLNQSREENKISKEAVERRLLDLTGGDLASCAHVKFEDLNGLNLPDAFLANGQLKMQHPCRCYALNCSFSLFSHQN